MPVMGLDVGDRSLGIALSDPSHTIARGVETIRGATFSRDRCLNRVKELVADEGVDTIVVGMPRNAAGEEGFQAQKVHTFISELRRWDVANGTVVWRVEGELGWFSAVEASADGKTLAGGDNEQLMVFDPDTGFMRQVLRKTTLNSKRGE